MTLDYDVGKISAACLVLIAEIFWTFYVRLAKLRSNTKWDQVCLEADALAGAQPALPKAKIIRVSNTPGNLLEISKVSWKFSG